MGGLSAPWRRFMPLPTEHGGQPWALECRLCLWGYRLFSRCLRGHVWSQRFVRSIEDCRLLWYRTASFWYLMFTFTGPFWIHVGFCHYSFVSVDYFINFGRMDHKVSKLIWIWISFLMVTNETQLDWTWKKIQHKKQCTADIFWGFNNRSFWVICF